LSSLLFVMLCRTLTGTVHGIDGLVVLVEVDSSGKGARIFCTVGLPDASVREAKDRVQAAVRNSLFELPTGRIIINLAPADVKKQGSAFDLAVAIGLVAPQYGNEHLHNKLEDTLLLGELALDGNVRPVRGVLPVVCEAKRQGLKYVCLPRTNAREATMVRGLSIYPVDSLRDTLDLLQRPVLPEPLAPMDKWRCSSKQLDLADVKGQFVAKRALEIAAAGGHNLLLSGPPGAGKTLLARRMPSILPELDFDEALEVTKVHSVAGKLDSDQALVSTPPFRAPHHTVSWAAMAGGGNGPMPGEVSLAHRGVLFLDELPEFQRNALEALRQPLEERNILISRVGSSVTYPAEFILVSAMNPCPCGYLGVEKRPCTCTPPMVHRYRGKISGPLLDRIDLHVFVRPLDAEEILGNPASEASFTVRKRVLKARSLQRKRFRRGRARVNARMTPRQISRYCPLDESSRSVVRQAIDRLGLSARAYHRIVKVARTIADLAGCDDILGSHLQEAIQYRVQEAGGDGGY
jgi:magnesium chelatase family protein